ncbi:MAG: hypothetical protein ACP5NP_02385 [Acetobacteraceae bacterium]
MKYLIDRRAALLLPLALAGCGGGRPVPVAYPRLDFSYLPQLHLNVARVAIEQHFIPSDVPPSVSQYDPVSPTAALRRMGEERLGAFGSAGKAVFVVTDAALTRERDIITGTFSVRLEIYTSAGTRVGFAEASVSREQPVEHHDLQASLYALTRRIMDRMNVEFEYQVRRALGTWLLPAGVKAAPVRAAPITATPAVAPTTGGPVQLVPVAPPPLPAAGHP